MSSDDCGLSNVGMTGEYGFDLAWFDAETADHHLVIDAAGELQFTVGVHMLRLHSRAEVAHCRVNYRG